MSTRFGLRGVLDQDSDKAPRAPLAPRAHAAEPAGKVRSGPSVTTLVLAGAGLLTLGWAAFLVWILSAMMRAL
ncbi:hypothetical protein [Alsobacter sp. SYSU BS001988]